MLKYLFLLIFTFFISVNCKNLTKIHIVYSNHLDVGFFAEGEVGFAINVINKYFDVHFPRAINTFNTLKSYNIHFVYTTQPWLVYYYLNCPNNTRFPGSLNCPTPQQRDSFISVVKQNGITWHAFPFNGEPEFTDPLLFYSGLHISNRLKEMFSKEKSITYSQRDVPGMTKAVIPHLRRFGIEAISLGINGASAPPNVPDVFIWGDRNNNSNSILVIQHKGGYGGLYYNDIAKIEGCDIGLATNWRGDNLGPPSYQEVLDDIEFFKKWYPNAEVFPSTLDNFIKDILPCKHTLPFVQSEIGDTWIHGVASDPYKTQLFREISRIRSNYCKNNPIECPTPTNIVDQNSPLLHFDALFIKNIEHTWGLDIKSYLNDTINWDNESFRKQLGSQNYRNSIQSWIEQRNYTNMAIKVLDGHPLSKLIKESIPHLRPKKFDLEGYRKISLNDELNCGRYTFSIGESGGIESLYDKTTNSQLASKQNVLGQFIYTTFSEDNYIQYMDEYGYCPYKLGECDWFILDFSKPNVSRANPVSREWKPKVLNIYSDFNNCNVIVELAMQEQESVKNYGASESLWIKYNFTHSNIEIDLHVLNKTATRIPEAMWLSFNPKVNSGYWSLSKLDAQINSNDIILNGSTHLHSTQDWNYFVPTNIVNQNTPLVGIYSLDAPLVSIGSRNPFPIPLNVKARQDNGLHYCLVNNIWGTNYPMWYPFLSEDSNIRYRFLLKFAKS